jgi:ubiquinone/menaquinone biosynthesis C-methylase UbiE
VTEASGTGSVGSYEQVASEYYDALRHPTCANFRLASAYLLERLVPDVPAEQCCEVGAGDSLLADLIWRRREDLAGLLVTDLNPAMLEYSRRWERQGATLAVAAASQLPVPDSSLFLLVASLADPYDDDSFWEEVERVLAPGGRCVVTTPSQTWAQRFRAQGAPLDAAEFELSDGSSVYLTSHVRSPQEERRTIERHGLRVVEEAAAALDVLKGPISEKLLVLRSGDAVVNGFVALAGGDDT